MIGGTLPRRRFLQGLVALPALGRVAAAASPLRGGDAVPPDALVEHRGWIVQARDRTALRAATSSAVRVHPGALQ